jgi:muramidase (phage lysozyme)
VFSVVVAALGGGCVAGSDPGDISNDCTQHPAVQHCAGSLCSDAAGRYQFLSTTWRGLGLPNFFPNDQDIGVQRELRRVGQRHRRPVSLNRARDQRPAV